MREEREENRKGKKVGEMEERGIERKKGKG